MLRLVRAAPAVKRKNAVPKYTTSGPIMWRVSAECPRCHAPLILRHTINYQPFLACARYPRCRFASGYDRMVHALLDRIIALQEALEALGYPVERSVP